MLCTLWRFRRAAGSDHCKCAAGAVAIGSVGLAKAKADHDESLGERKGVHELSPEEKKELKTIAPVREEYLDGGLVVLVGKDTEAAVGMRVRMRDGLISHGEIEFCRIVSVVPLC